MAMNRRYHPAVWACMEALYQSVWAQSFSLAYAGPLPNGIQEAQRGLMAASRADAAAANAVRFFSFKQQDFVVTEKGQQL